MAKRQSTLIRGVKYIGRSILKAKNSIVYAFDKNSIILSYCDTKSCKNNFGDALNPHLVEKLSGKTVYSYRTLLFKPNQPVFCVIGSILNDLNIPNAEIWGAGFISEDGSFKKKPTKVHAVRGPLTRQLVLDQGIKCPEVYGDPALLLPMFYQPQKTKEYKLGIIPHFVDKKNQVVLELKENYPDDVLIIDIEKPIENVITNINRCQHIASSSLHGMIVADAYQIPSCWIELSKNVIGEGFKFRDYMLSVNKTQFEPVLLKDDITLDELLGLFNHEPVRFNPEVLLRACPFNRNYTI